MNVGEKIKSLRKEKRMTINELANRSGVCVVTISLIETGKSAKPSIITLKKISNGLECDYKELYDIAHK